MKKKSRLKALIFLPMILWLLSLNVLAAPIMVDRNLFAPDRKPPSDQPAPPGPQSGQQSLQVKSIQLDGVFFRDAKRTALIRLKSPMANTAARDPKKAQKPESPFRKVTEGEQLGDFVVSKIDGRSITLEKDGEAHVVRLFAEGKVLPPLAPAAVPRVPAPNAPQQPGTDDQAATGQMQPGDDGQLQPPTVPGMEQGDQQAAARGRRGRRLNQSAPYPPGDPNFGVNPQAGVAPQVAPENDQAVGPGQEGGDEEMVEE